MDWRKEPFQTANGSERTDEGPDSTSVASGRAVVVINLQASEPPEDGRRTGRDEIGVNRYRKGGVLLLDVTGESVGVYYRTCMKKISIPRRYDGQWQ